jgi:hypothetical protein
MQVDGFLGYMTAVVLFVLIMIMSQICVTGVQADKQDKCR